MDKNFTIYYAGNSLLEEDNMPFRILPFLEERFPEVEFKHHDPNENLPVADVRRLQGRRRTSDSLVIVDAVEGIEKVITISDPGQLATDSVYSPHDWDLALNLKLLLKLGELREFLIIGVPMSGDVEEIAREAGEIIKELLE